MVKDLEIISTGKLLHVKAGGESGNEACVTLARAVDEQVREHGSVCVLLETRRSCHRSAMAWWQTARGDFKVVHCDPMKLDEAKQWLESGGHQEREECNHGIS
ncbi:hypothetical protein SH139x_002069 [Planctomycetaceae bacterium SH139]